MGSTIFKRLFEVQIVHDYYLTTADGTSFFDRNQEEKKDIISKKLLNRIYDVKSLFVIEPNDSTKKNLDTYKLIWAKTALGFIVGTEVSVENQAGEIVYKPRFELKPELHFTFSIQPQASFFNGMTNISLRPSIPSIYYFTNKNKEVFNEPTLPAYISTPISNKVAAVQDGKIYEMGALAELSGSVQEAIQYTDGTDPNHWQAIDDKRFVSDADRMLLPNKFEYKLKKSQNITQINFVLLDQSDTEIKTISKTATEAFENIKVDLTKVEDNDIDSDTIPSGYYTLKIQENAGPELLYPIYLNTEIYDKYNLGVVDIRLDEEDSPYSLLDANGFLKTRISAANQKISHPVFEIRFKNRKTYWRYNKEGDFSPAEIAGTAAHLQHSTERLVSIKPKALTAALVPFQDGGSLLLPYPAIPSIKLENDKIFSEIFINPSNRLLNN